MMSDLSFLNLLVYDTIYNYQIKGALLCSEEFIAGIKKGTSYNIQRLDRYERIVASVKHEGNRLERRVCESTDPRRKAFESVIGTLSNFCFLFA
jgi:hypothetical protein